MQLTQISWLLQIPYPENSSAGRYWYNILIDPWLQGGQSDVAWWFSQQFHANDSKVGSIADVEELARRIEILTGGLSQGKNQLYNNQEAGGHFHTFVDAVVLSHEFTDHCHKATLLEIHESVPVLATKKAAELVKSWRHFRVIHEVPLFPGKSLNWRDASLPPLPDWLGVARLTSKSDFLDYHSALAIVFESPTPNTNIHHSLPSGADGQPAAAEAVIYTPHGIDPRAVAVITKASPPIKTLAFMHGLHDVQLSAQQLNLGAHNGLEAQNAIHARYWIGTHDEVKSAGGLVKWFLRRKIITVNEAFQQAAQKTSNQNGKSGTLEDVFRHINFEEIGNGESLVLR